MDNTSRRSTIRIVSFVLAGFVALGTSAAINSVRAQNLAQQVEAANERALGELGEYISNIQTSLQKGLYANTPGMAAKLSMQLRQEAAGAKSSLSQLALGETEAENLYRFLSQVGEFALTLAEKLDSGQDITADERENLKNLSAHADQLAIQIEDIRTAMGNDSLDFSRAVSTLASTGEGMYIGDYMDDIEQSMSDLPTLIYDGPFSDHIMQAEPKMTAGAPEISLSEATEIASQVSGIAAEELEHTEDEAGTMPSYSFTHGETTISITKNGGYLSYMLSSRYADEATIGYKEAVEKAKEYLDQIGYTNMTESYYSISDGICTINFAYTQDGVICYPDLIKVSVALDNGDVTGVDARGYLMNHTQRTIGAPALTSEQAAANVSKSLEIESSRPVIIPTDSLGEEYCYEFTCKSASGEDVLIYIDTATGQEDNILILTYSDNGIFAR